MKLHFKVLFRFVLIVAAIYIVACTALYFNQESILFHPKSLPVNHTYESEVPFEEINVVTQDKTKLNALLFKAEKSRGLIFYIHGNAGNLDGWTDVAKTYTDLNYDVFLFDFRGFGKSEGTIESEEQFFEDVRQCYAQMLARYEEKDIIILGYSIGTGPAAMLASENKPKSLILLSPYFSLTDMMRKQYSFAPTFILKYKFATNEFLSRTKVPVTIFHGKDDETIYFGSSLKLQKLFKRGDRLFPLEDQKHNGMDNNLEYQKELRKILINDQKTWTRD